MLHVRAHVKLSRDGMQVSGVHEATPFPQVESAHAIVHVKIGTRTR